MNMSSVLQYFGNYFRYTMKTFYEGKYFNFHGSKQNIYSVISKYKVLT